MKTIDRLILKSFIGPMLLSFLIVMFVLLMQFMWRYIDELVGRGIGMDIIFEFMLYAMAISIPMGLPLSTLFAVIMTMGNLGENYELLAMKSAGMSLPRIITPLVGVVFVVCIGSYFAANDLVPHSFRKMLSLIYDIRQQRQTIEFKEGIFFNGIDNVSIRVESQDPKTRLLQNILIYDNRDYSGNTITMLADSGYIRLSEDRRFLLVSLYSGSNYEQTRDYKWLTEGEWRRHRFVEQELSISIDGYDFQRSDDAVFATSQTRNIKQLSVHIDSLELMVKYYLASSYKPLVEEYMFVYEPNLLNDSIKVDMTGKMEAYLIDSIPGLTMEQKRMVFFEANVNLNSSRNTFSYDEESAKETLNQLYRYKIEWHKKLVLPISIMIFFLIGAPIGAIIRKGGLGMPVVASVFFFVIYYVINLAGEKMAHEGSWETYRGVWLATIILFPLAVFLTYKATRDSGLFEAEWYSTFFRKIKAVVTSIIPRRDGRKAA